MLQNLIQGEVILNFLIGGVGLTAVVAAVAVFKMVGPGEKKLDIDEVINDFRVLRSAFTQFKKKTIKDYVKI